MDVEDQLEQLKSKKAEIRQRREELALEEDLVDSQIKVLARRAHGAAPELPARTDRIVEVLRSSGSPMSPREIANRLAVVEPDITPKIVRGTLAYLKRQGTVENRVQRLPGAGSTDREPSATPVGAGNWSMRPDHRTQQASSPAVSAATKSAYASMSSSDSGRRIVRSS